MSQLASPFLLLLFLVEIHCQPLTFPYVSFMGHTLADHSYVDISQVGTSGSDSVQCHTGLSHGQWFFPNRTGLGNSTLLAIYQRSLYQRVELHRHSGTGAIGIYQCGIEKNAVQGYNYGEIVYVGLYTNDGGKYNHL